MDSYASIVGHHYVTGLIKSNKVAHRTYEVNTAQGLMIIVPRLVYDSLNEEFTQGQRVVVTYRNKAVSNMRHMREEEKARFQAELSHACEATDIFVNGLVTSNKVFEGQYEVTTAPGIKITIPAMVYNSLSEKFRSGQSVVVTYTNTVVSYMRLMVEEEKAEFQVELSQVGQGGSSQSQAPGSQNSNQPPH